MKRFGLTILFCFLLSGCIFDPAFDLSNWDAYQKSLTAIKAKLSDNDLRRLDVALNYLLVEGLPRVTGGSQLVNYVPSAGLADPNTILNRLRPRIDGRSASAVVGDLAVQLDAEISSAEARLQGAGSAADAVEVQSPRYYWLQSGYRAQPVVEFAVRNNGNVPISRMSFDCSLVTPNRSVPWVRQQFTYTFKGGLEPREKFYLKLQQYGGLWGDPQLKDLANAELKVIVVNFEDANGVKMMVVDRERLDLERRVRASLR